MAIVMNEAPELSRTTESREPALHRLRAWFSALFGAAESARALKGLAARADHKDLLFEELKQHVWDSHRRNDEANRRVTDMSQRLDAGQSQMLVLFEELKQHVWDSLRRNDEASQRIMELSQRLDADHAHAQGLKREIMFQQRRLSRLGEQLSTPDKALPAVGGDLVDERIDSLYVAFEDTFRGSREDIKARLIPYIERVQLAGAGPPGKPILDIGCGRGEWLELLREHHLEAYGVDLNSIMIERCKALGLETSRADAIGHLRELPDESRSAITAFHVIEHVPFEVFINFLDEALRVLVPGGVLLLETPNPETIRVGATTFYYDPTHRNPLPPLPTQFIVQHRGFVDVEILRLHPVTEERLLGTGEDVDLLNRVLFGPQDYAIIARRDEARPTNTKDIEKMADQNDMAS